MANEIMVQGAIVSLNINDYIKEVSVSTSFTPKFASYPTFVLPEDFPEDLKVRDVVVINGHVEIEEIKDDDKTIRYYQKFYADNITYKNTLLEEHFGLLNVGKKYSDSFSLYKISGEIVKITESDDYYRYFVKTDECKFPIQISERKNSKNKYLVGDHLYSLCYLTTKQKYVNEKLKKLEYIVSFDSFVK